MKNKECKICGLKPQFYSDGTYSRYDSAIELTSGGWTNVFAAKDENNKVCIYGLGDDYTENYYPKYCPECGRKLHD